MGQMNRAEYNVIKSFVLSQNYDFVHDFTHIERVLGYALKISESFAVDYNVLIAACLLHDVGRAKNLKTEKLSHEIISSNVAYEFLIKNNWERSKAENVREAIISHSFRGKINAISVEGKVLFDADKIDLTGYIGVSRMLMYGYKIKEPLYVINENDSGIIGVDLTEHSFIKSYIAILKNVSEKMYTEIGRRIIIEREKNAQIFFDGVLLEINSSLDYQQELEKHLD